MSYASEIKRMMSQDVPHMNCCRKAYLNGFLITSATHHERDITIRLSGGDVCHAFYDLLEKVLHAAWQAKPCRGGGETYEITFSSASAARYLETMEQGGDVSAVSLRCEECRKWFLRGMFLSAGNPSDPERGFRLDLTPRYHLIEIAEYLTSIGLKPLVAQRRGKQILYYHSGEPIGDLFAMMGETDIYFSLQDAFFKRELSNLTNRQNNCTVGNIMRSVRSGGELIDLLLRMKQQNKMSLLPDDLRTTAELRLSYPDYTIPQLAAISVPSLTKSGLNHRLNRILEIARKLDL